MVKAVYEIDFTYRIKTSESMHIYSYLHFKILLSKSLVLHPVPKATISQVPLLKGFQ